MLFQLFIEFLKIGTFSFGGGLATLPHIYNLAEKTGWYSATEVTNMITISQMTPGPLACNMATYVGFKLNGVLASFIATSSFIIPAILFMGIVYKLLDKFKNNETINFILKIIRASALATITASSFIIFKMAFLNNVDTLEISSIIYDLNFKCIILAVVLIFLIKKFKITTIQSMILSAVIGVVFNL